MSQCKEKTTCVFFRSLFDAAERIHETNPETAYEIYRSYFRYAFCETEDIETDDMVAELLVRQNVESFNAADERYSNAVKNGEKGKDYGILGKEYGKLGGRPRKGETREEYWERKRKQIQETPQETPLISGDKETPLTIATAITTSEASTYSSSISKDITSSLSNNISKEEKKETIIEKDDSKYYEDFLSNPTKDYSDLLNDVSNFVNMNITELNVLQHNLNEYHQVDEYPTRIILKNLQYFYKEKLERISQSNL